jgi:dCMP deaminase
MGLENKRQNWEEYALSLAQCASVRSEDPYHKVGACALSHSNRVLGLAYNGLTTGKNVGKKFWSNRDKRRPFMIHAETNLLSLFKRDECRLIAVTTKPCSYCARLICAWNIPLVIYQNDYPADTTETDEIFNFYRVKTKQIRLKI